MRFKNSLLILIAFLLSFSVYGQQEQMERLYRSDRQNTGVDIRQTSDNGYLILSAGRPLDSTYFEYYTITKMSDKGDIAWSKDYQFETKVVPDGALRMLTADSFMVVGVLRDTALNKIIMKMDPAGNVTSTSGYGRSDTNLPMNFGDVAIDTTLEGGFLLAGDAYEDANNSDVYVSKLDSSMNVSWANVLERNGENDVIHKARTTRDSGAILCGTTNHATDGENILLIRTDSTGQVMWSRQYGTTIDEYGTSVIQTADNGFLVGGRKLETNSYPGVLIKTDPNGMISWVQKIDFGTTDTVHINDLLLGSNGDLVVSGSLLTDTTSFAFMVKLDFAGNMVWKRRYKTATNESLTANGLNRTGDQGFIYLTSSDESGEQVGPYLIKTDQNGETLCDTAIMETILIADTIAIDTIAFTATSLMDSKEVNLADTLNYTGFNPPIVVLPTFGPYCPDEMFSDTLDATIDGAVSYEWSNDETTPSIVVDEFGEYTVTVTMGEDYCYILCTTSTISEKPLPEVQIAIDQSPYCTQGFVNMGAITANTDSIVWSTGQINQTPIQVMTDGTYSVTAFNECDFTVAETDLSINTTPPDVSITPEGDYCTEGQETLTASISGAVNSLLWSNGEDTDLSIIADTEGSYSITISTDFCGDNTANYELIAPPPPTVSISSAGDFCIEGQETLTATASGLFNSIEWDTGDTTNTIIANQAGGYTVTVSADFCGENSDTYTLVPGTPSIAIDTLTRYL